MRLDDFHTCLPQLAKNKNKKNKSQNRPNHTINNMQSHQLITAHDERVCISKQTYHAFSENISEQWEEEEIIWVTLRCAFGMNNLPYMFLGEKTHIDDEMNLTHR